MDKIIRIENVENLILAVRGKKVILDSDVAELYGVETRRINEAVKNNPGKFPAGYIIELSKNELETSIELNFAILKFRHSIKMKKDEKGES